MTSEWGGRRKIDGQLIHLKDFNVNIDKIVLYRRQPEGDTGSDCLWLSPPSSARPHTGVSCLSLLGTQHI